MGRRAAVLMVLAGGVGCNAHVHAPPTRLIPARPPSAVQVGRAELHASGTLQAGLFTAGVLGGELGFGYGLAPRWGLELDGYLLKVGEGSLASLRSGVRFAPWEHLNLTAGVGAGTPSPTPKASAILPPSSASRWDSASAPPTTIDAHRGTRGRTNSWP